jgi:hypothetical protein
MTNGLCTQSAARAAIGTTSGLTLLAGRHIARNNPSSNTVTSQQFFKIDSTAALKGTSTISDQIRTVCCAS